MRVLNTNIDHDDDDYARRGVKMGDVSTEDVSLSGARVGGFVLCV